MRSVPQITFNQALADFTQSEYSYDADDYVVLGLPPRLCVAAERLAEDGWGVVVCSWDDEDSCSVLLFLFGDMSYPLVEITGTKRQYYFTDDSPVEIAAAFADAALYA